MAMLAMLGCVAEALTRARGFQTGGGKQGNEIKSWEEHTR